MLEKVSENRLKAAIENAGGMCIKILPSLAGLPDRLAVMPWGDVVWLELKADGGRVRRVQASMHRRLEGLHQDVRVIIGREGVDNFIRWMEIQKESITIINSYGVSGHE